jgi:hypothetical protein
MVRRAWMIVAAATVLGAGLPAPAREGALPSPDVPWASGWRSRAAVEWEAHRDLPWRPGVPAAFTMSATAPRPVVEVLGFLPYWMVGEAVVPMQRLTSLAYFGVEVRADGTLGDTRDWGSATLMPLVTAARDAGVRVLLTATCFDATAMTSMLNSAALRAKAVGALVDLVASGGGDGVNLDFEGLPLARKAQFTTFVGELKAALQEALGRSDVTVDTPAVDWEGAYDYDGLALAGDGLVIMGYDYHYRGGDPGPVAPLAASTAWGKYSLDWTLKDYDQFGGVANRGRFVLALPLYGYDWPATSDKAPASATGAATARFYADCARRATDAGGWRWDDDSATPWFAWQDGGWRQTWCEDLRSLTAKVALAAGRDLGGVAFWALGYEEGSDDPWAAIDAAWPPAVAEGGGDGAPDGGADAADPGADALHVDWLGGDGAGHPEGWTPGMEVALPPDGEAPGADGTPGSETSAEAGAEAGTDGPGKDGVDVDHVVPRHRGGDCRMAAVPGDGTGGWMAAAAVALGLLGARRRKGAGGEGRGATASGPA